MSDAIEDIAQKFVIFYLKHTGNKSEHHNLSEDDAALLLKMIHAAGFEAARVENGWLYEEGRDGDIHVNSHCPFRVIDPDNADKQFGESLKVPREHPITWITGWLDCVFLMLHQKTDWGRRNVNEKELIDCVALEIKRSQPLAPIQITLSGDHLHEIPPDKRNPSDDSFPAFFDHTKDSDKIEGRIGIHEDYGCGGIICLRYSNYSMHIATCNCCGLKIEFPKTIETYGELRAHMDEVHPF